ncbi:MAG TPA: hypothetical protein VMM84_05110 [Pyrinomonadaceae bacterium]|nr:hypothetical protein [Pyrinomonadaceae bacterium]
MMRTRQLAVGVLLLISLILLGLWWNTPRRIDMARYAPANSLVYLEANSVLEIAEQLSRTEAWKALDPPVQLNPGRWRNRLTTLFVGWTGIGSDEHVLLARSQVALVMTDLAAMEEGEVLNVKPAAAILIETHTSESRIRPVVEKLLGKFAKAAYQTTVHTRTTFQNLELIEWKSNGGDRRVIAVIDGSLIIIGNDERAVKSCLAVRRGQQLSLINDGELRQMRGRLNSANALTFGYVPKANSAHLLAQIAPLLFGRGPGDLQLEKLLGSGASKLVESFGWSSQARAGGIEDRYFCEFNPAFASRLQVPLEAASISNDVWDLLPPTVHSVTIYNYKDPAAVWANFETAVSSQLDTLSALLADAIIKGSLMSYGIKEPLEFFKTVHPELLTARLSQDAEHSLVIARVRDKTAVERVIARETGSDRGNEDALAAQDISVAFVGEYILLGTVEDVRHCLRAHQESVTMARNGKIRQVTHFSLDPSLAGVMTYSDETQRVRGFIRALRVLNEFPSTTSVPPRDLDDRIAQLPFSASQTTVRDSGLERITQSSFGQFSNLLPLILPNQTNEAKDHDE